MICEGLARGRRRRRLLEAAAAASSRLQKIILTTVLLSDDRAARYSNPHKQCRRFDRMHWEAHAAGFAPDEFKRAYRMDLPTFYKLLGEIEESIETKNTKQAERSSSGPVASAVRLSMTLRYLAGGNVNDIYRMHGVSRDEMYKSVWVVVDAINNHPSFGMVFPIDDDERLAHIEAGFRAKSTNQLHRGCVGAIDGLFVKIRRPNYPTEDEHPARFFCGRKKAYGLNVQAVCDADRRFLDVDIRFPGASGDSLAHRCSELGGKLADGLLSSIYHLIGDAAYINSEHMLTPVSGTAAQIGSWADSYNFHQVA